MKIAVGMSGGVDSSVAALLLKREGHEVFGVTMKIWRGIGASPPASPSRNACYGPDEGEDIESAKSVCAALGIPHHTVDCAERYERVVLDYFRTEYRAGRTPNPCVRCNQTIKFGVLPQAMRESGVVFDKFATGHYARITSDPAGFLLRTGVERGKDQSYFLYRLSQEQLAMTLFPLGSLRKSEVRAIAREAGLAVHDKRESQDFCSGDLGELIGGEARDGEIVDSSGRLLGRHEGIWNYTVGQRKGLGIPWSEPLYVLKIDAANNRVVVGTEAQTHGASLLAADCVWSPAAGDRREAALAVKIRSASPEAPATVTRIGEREARVVFDRPCKAITPGQSAVFYEGDVVVGGGIIQEVNS